MTILEHKIKHVLKQLRETRHRPTSIIRLLANFWLSHVWNNPFCLHNLKSFNLLFKERVIDVLKQECVNKIFQS